MTPLFETFFKFIHFSEQWLPLVGENRTNTNLGSSCLSSENGEDASATANIQDNLGKYPDPDEALELV